MNKDSFSAAISLSFLQVTDYEEELCRLLLAARDNYEDCRPALFSGLLHKSVPGLAQCTKLQSHIMPKHIF